MNSPERQTLLRVAREAVLEGVRRGVPWLPDPQEYPATLRAPGASFVTLHVDGELHGCVGSLEPARPLVVDVAHNAFAAAFHDPRFPRLEKAELDALDVHISLLGPLEALDVASEAELVTRLRPGIDGLLLEEGRYRGTFLPAVWQNLSNPAEFVRALKRKAGLAPDHWSDAVRVWRYEAESIPPVTDRAGSGDSRR